MIDHFIFKMYPDMVPARPKKGSWGGRRPGSGRKPVLRDPVSFTLDFEGPQMDLLEAIAGKRGISVAAVVREAVGRFLARRRKR